MIQAVGPTKKEERLRKFMLEKGERMKFGRNGCELKIN